LTGKIPVAVIGVGEHGRKHARAYRDVPGAQLVGVFDARPERTRETAAELGVTAFASLDEALGAVRGVSIVIPTFDHAKVAEYAMARGVDVMLEKPVSRTVEEAECLIALAERLGRILQVGHLERFNPSTVAARREIRQPLFFEIHRLGVFSPRSLDVDVVFDLMIHDLDLVLWFTGSRVADVRAVGLPVLSDKVDIANARVEFENGAVANLTASRVSTERVRKFRFFQAYEYISLDFARRDALVVGVDRNGTSPRFNFRKLEKVPQEPIQAELMEFVESIRTRRPPLVGGREGKDALAVAELVMKCIEQHAARLHVPMGRAVGQSGEE
jgi:predicted dehydrogenase